MKNFLYTLTALVLGSVAVLSCSSSDDDVEYSDQCYISSFVLGQMRRTLHTTDSEGNDSVYYLSFSGSAYQMLIDQRNQTITNRDSLPLGTRLEAALATITSSGGVVYGSSSSSTEWIAYSASDSINFSQPLVFRVYAPDGASYRDYTVKLNVRQADPSEYTWTQQAVLPFAAGSISDCSLLSTASGLAVFATTLEGNVCHLRSDASGEWTSTECTGLGFAPNVRNAQYFGGHYWMSCYQSLYTSADGIVWQEVALPAGMKLIQLVAASSTALYASTEEADGTIAMASTTDGTTWTPMDVEEGGFTGLPAAAVAYDQQNGNHRVLMAVEVFDSSSPLFIWSLLEGKEEPWTLFAEYGANDYLLPAMHSLSIVPYNGQLIAFGGALATGDSESALTATYVSHDNGITWKTGEGPTVPAVLQGTTEPIAARSQDDLIWLLVGNQLWRGRLNSYGE